MRDSLQRIHIDALEVGDGTIELRVFLPTANQVIEIRVPDRPGVQLQTAACRRHPADRGAYSIGIRQLDVPASYRCQSATFHSSESHAFIRTPFRVFACAETLPRQMSGIM